MTTLHTERLVLRPLDDDDRGPFADMNAHPRVAETMGSTLTRAESDADLERYAAEMEIEDWGFWAVEISGGARFAGIVGLHRVPEGYPWAPAVETGWRLHPDHWGQGYATEAARASLDYGFTVGGLTEIVAFTAVINVRSQAVMERLGMVRDPEGDFDHPRLEVGSPLLRHVLYRVRA